VPRKLGCSTLVLRTEPVEDALKPIEAAGFSAVEIWGNDPRHIDLLDRRRLTDLREAVSSSALEVVSILAPRRREMDISSPSTDDRRLSVSVAKSLIHSACLLDAQFLVMHPGWGDPDSEAKAYRFAAESLDELVTTALDCGVTLCIENPPPGTSFCDSAPRVVHLVRSLGLDGLKVCLNVGHSNLYTSPAEDIQICGPDLGLVHLSDNDGSSDQHLPPGQGSLDLPGVLQSLDRSPGEVPVVLDIYGPTPPGAEDLLRRSLEMISSLSRGVG